MSEESHGSTAAATISNVENGAHQVPKVGDASADGGAQPLAGAKTDGSQHPAKSIGGGTDDVAESASAVADPARSEEVLYETAAATVKAGTTNGEIVSDNTGPPGTSGASKSETADEETSVSAPVAANEAPEEAGAPSESEPEDAQVDNVDDKPDFPTIRSTSEEDVEDQQLATASGDVASPGACFRLFVSARSTIDSTRAYSCWLVLLKFSALVADPKVYYE